MVDADEEYENDLMDCDHDWQPPDARTGEPIRCPRCGYETEEP